MKNGVKAHDDLKNADCVDITNICILYFRMGIEYY